MLPILLAGPILKKLTKNEVKIWFATSVEPKEIKVTFFLGGSSEKVLDAHVEFIRVAEFCYLALVTVVSLFKSNRYYKYDFTLDGKSLLQDRELSLEPTSDTLNFDLPGFTIKNEVTHIAHASCRKPHGGGHDAIVLLEDQLREQSVDILFFTGDQIYADDVDRFMFEHLQTVIATLKFPTESFKTINYELGPGRSTLLREHARLTTENSNCHLILMAEFIVMHLLAFSPELWPRTPEPHLTQFYQGCRSIQKVMANVPTFFMFDDHEVTDDWNLDETWKSDVSSTILGKQLIANALTAYFLCQAWGNNHTIDQRAKLIERRVKSPENVIDQNNILSKDWSYITDTQPSAYVLDTRSQRFGFAERMYMRRPELLSALSKIDEKTIILISPSPIFGMPVLEKLQDSGAKIFSAAKFDHERWFNDAFKLLLDSLKKSSLDRVILLSGDIHYAMNVHAEVLRSKGKSSLHLCQMISSSIKNQNKFSKYLNFFEKFRNLVKGWVRGESDVEFYWKILNPSGLWNTCLGDSVIVENNIGLVLLDDLTRGRIVHTLFYRSQENSKPEQQRFEFDLNGTK